MSSDDVEPLISIGELSVFRCSYDWFDQDETLLTRDVDVYQVAYDFDDVVDDIRSMSEKTMDGHKFCELVIHKVENLGPIHTISDLALKRILATDWGHTAH